ncbi:hypothetical protein [Cupriavidus necator]
MKTYEVNSHYQKNGKPTNWAVSARVQAVETHIGRPLSAEERSKLIVKPERRYDRRQQKLSTVEFVEGRATLGGKVIDSTHGRTIKYDGVGIYVLMPGSNGRPEFIYSRHQSYGEIQHATLANGRPVLAAGYVAFKNGKVVAFDNGSKHYTPSVESLELLKEFFRAQGVLGNEYTVTHVDHRHPEDTWSERRNTATQAVTQVPYPHREITSEEFSRRVIDVVVRENPENSLLREIFYPPQLRTGYQPIRDSSGVQREQHTHGPGYYPRQPSHPQDPHQPGLHQEKSLSVEFHSAPRRR